MTTKTVRLDIVSPEGRLFGDAVLSVHVRGGGGELGIFPGHLQLLTDLPPGLLRIVLPSQEERALYVSGGILEVQPHQISVLADTVERPEEMNELAAQQARESAEAILKSTDKGSATFEEAQQDLAEALAKLQVIEWVRLKKKRH